MTAHEEKARDLFYKGCNCAQAVFAAFSDIMGIDEISAEKISASFGGGFGRMREVCGAVSGMTLAYSWQYGYTDFSTPEPKTENYRAVAELMNKFKDEKGSYICRDLLGITDGTYSPVAQERTPEFYATRPCLSCVMTAARLLDEAIAAKQQ